MIGSRLMVHPTSVTNAIERLVAAGLRRAAAATRADGRGVLAAITDAGRDVVGAATEALTGSDFGLADLPDAELDALFDAAQEGPAGRRRRRAD